MTQRLVLARRLERLLGSNKFLARSEFACWILLAILAGARIIFGATLQAVDIALLVGLPILVVAFKRLLARSQLI